MPKREMVTEAPMPPAEAREICRQAVSELGWQILEEEDGRLVAKESWSMGWSWPVKAEILIGPGSAEKTPITIQGSIGGMGPIQSAALDERLESLATKISGAPEELELEGGQTAVMADSGVQAAIGQLNKRARGALEQNLTPGEAVQVVIHGAHGQAIVGTDTRAFVIKPGFMAGATFGAEVTSWSYRNLVGVQVHKGMLTGSVVIQAPGQVGQKTSYWGQGKDDPAKAPNAIPVAGGTWDAVRQGVARLQQLIDAAHTPQQPQAAPTSASVADELKKLGELRDSGVISDEEFAQAKQQLLGG